jgi:hypothetical protein
MDKVGADDMAPVEIGGKDEASSPLIACAPLSAPAIEALLAFGLTIVANHYTEQLLKQ